MFALRRKPPAAVADAAPLRGSTVDGEKVVRAIGHHASGLGREAAEVRGMIEDAARIGREQAEAVQALARQMAQVATAQDAIGRETSDSREAVVRARDAVQQVGSEVVGIVDTLQRVSEAAGQITRVALQTRLVAFNASVEAKRAGESGRGFGVVADAVKDLAGQVERSSKDILQTIGQLDARIASLARELRRRDDTAMDQQGGFHRALAEVDSGVGRIEQAAQRSRDICSGLSTQTTTLEAQMQSTGTTLDAALGRSESFLKVSEQLIEAVAESGVETDDTPYIRAAQDAANQIAALLQQALDSGAISTSALFDEAYRPIPNTAPQQHLTAFVELADRLFPPVQEGVLGRSDKIVYCIAADRNGYVAVHNRKYCQPQRGDLAWDTANSRWRRVFTDRTSLASVRIQRPFLLQTYRRDMGGGHFVVMKEAAAPIAVGGRHWGGLRLAFKF